MKLDLPPFDPVTDPSAVGQRWTSWKKRFEKYIKAMNVRMTSKGNRYYCFTSDSLQ